MTGRAAAGLTSPAALLLAAVVLLTVYRLWWIDHSGITLFIDEAYYWGWSRELAWGYYSKPPAIAALIALGTGLFGDGVLGVKSLTLLLYPLTAGVVYWLGRELFDWRTGLLAAAVWFGSCHVGILGLFASTDAPLLLCWALAAGCYWRAMHAEGWRWWAATGLVAGLGLLSKYTMLAFGLTVAVTLGLRWWRAGTLPWGRIALAAALALLVFAPHLAWNWQNGFPTLRHTVEITAQARQSGGIGALAEFMGGQLLMLGPLAPVFLLAAGLAVWRERMLAPPWPRPGSGWLSATEYLLALALPLLLLSAALALQSRANMNWAAPAYIALALLFARLCTRPARPLARRWWTAVLVLNLAIVALVGHAADLARLAGQPLPVRLDAFARMRGWDEALARLRPAADGASGPLLGLNRTVLAHAVYHWRDLPLQPLAWNPAGRVDDQYQLTSRLDDWRGRDLLIVTEGALPDALRQRFAAVRPLGSATGRVGPDRSLTLNLYRGENFLGYVGPR